MIIINSVILIGRLTRDPELRYLPNGGTAVCNFSLAVDKGLSKSKKEEMESQGKPTADFPRCVAWGKTAELISQYMKKGSMMGIQGSLQTGRYDDKDGKTIYTTDVNVFKVEFLGGNNGNSSGNSNDNGGFDGDGFHPVDSEDIPF